MGAAFFGGNDSLSSSVPQRGHRTLRLMAIRAVLFDLWGTLIVDPPERSRPRQLWRAASVREALIAHDLDVRLQDVDAALIAVMRSLGELQDAGKDLAQGGRARLFAVTLETGFGRPVPERSLSDVETAITCMPAHLAPHVEPHA